MSKQDHNPRFPVGTRVRVRSGLSVPEWATRGTVTYNPGPNSDWHKHPEVEWDSDGKKRHVADNWLERFEDRNYRKAMCSCPRIIRVAPKTLEEAPISCLMCGAEFRTPPLRSAHP